CCAASPPKPRSRPPAPSERAASRLSTRSAACVAGRRPRHGFAPAGRACRSRSTRRAGAGTRSTRFGSGRRIDGKATAIASCSLPFVRSAQLIGRKRFVYFCGCLSRPEPADQLHAADRAVDAFDKTHTRKGVLDEELRRRYGEELLPISSSRLDEEP